MSKSRCKIEIPSQLPGSGLTRVQFKSWKEAMIVYLKQNDDFCVFFHGGRYETWMKADEFHDRIQKLDTIDEAACSTQDSRSEKLNKRQTDLYTMLNKSVWPQ